MREVASVQFTLAESTLMALSAAAVAAADATELGFAAALATLKLHRM